MLSSKTLFNFGYSFFCQCRLGRKFTISIDVCSDIQARNKFRFLSDTKFISFYFRPAIAVHFTDKPINIQLKRTWPLIYSCDGLGVASSCKQFNRTKRKKCLSIYSFYCILLFFSFFFFSCYFFICKNNAKINCKQNIENKIESKFIFFLRAVPVNIYLVKNTRENVFSFL